MVTDREVRHARWEMNGWGGAEVSYTLQVRGPKPETALALVKRKRWGEMWLAGVETPNGERALKRFASAGRARRYCRQVVLSLLPEQRAERRAGR